MSMKKLLALVLALTMVLSVSAAAAYSVVPYGDAEAIAEGAEVAVEMLYNMGIMKGDNKGNFNPEATITRAEVAKMIYVILNYGEDDLAKNYTGGKFFSDVEAGYWAEGYINYCASTKLIAGRGDGTFDPTAPVTTAEAAKMILTALGYSAEARGYTGANWDQNVLSDAAILGLLKGYKSNVNTYAPRQWVAVMFENALLDCYTFGTMRPSFSGLLISGEDDWDYEFLGEKYYGLKDFESVALATTSASMKVGTFAADYVLFTNGKEVKNTGLKAADLGQTYRVIYKEGSPNVAYSVRSLYETAEARLLDIEADIVYGTSSNKAQNKYEFTVDGVTAKFAASTIPVLRTGTEKYANVSKSRTPAGEMDVADFYKLIDDETKTNDLYKVILNEDGEIAYIIVTEYAYAWVNKAATHNRYGDYIVVDKNAADDATDLLTFNSETNLYLDDCIISADEIAKNDVVKYTWDLDEGMFVMEVLPYVEDVVYEARDNTKKIYTLDGEKYYVAAGALNDVQGWVDVKSNLGKSVCVVYDGDMLVYYWLSDSDYTDMADINAQLAVVIDIDTTYSTGTLNEKNVIEYMTIDGETHIAEYQDKYDSSNKTEDVQDSRYLWFADLVERDLYAATSDDELEGRLFILHEGTKGRVYLEELKADTVNAQLDASKDLLNLYQIKDREALDATKSSIKFGTDTVAADNVFFYAYFDNNGTPNKVSDDEVVYKVITAADLSGSKDADAYGQVLSYKKSPSNRITVLGGYIVANMESGSTSDYLQIIEIGEETADGVELTIQKLGSDETETIYVDDAQTFYTDLLYAYTYTTVDGEWTLTLVDNFNQYRVVGWYDETYTELYLDAKQAKNQHTLDVSDDDVVDYIVITTIEYVRDETQSDATDEDWLNENELDSYSRVLEIVAYEDLTDDAIENGADTASYTQGANWYYDADAELVYVIVTRDMTQAQEAKAAN